MIAGLGLNICPCPIGSVKTGSLASPIIGSCGPFNPNLCSGLWARIIKSFPDGKHSWVEVQHFPVNNSWRDKKNGLFGNSRVRPAFEANNNLVSPGIRVWMQPGNATKCDDFVFEYCCSSRKGSLGSISLGSSGSGSGSRKGSSGRGSSGIGSGSGSIPGSGSFSSSSECPACNASTSTLFVDITSSSCVAIPVETVVCTGGTLIGSGSWNGTLSNGVPVALLPFGTGCNYNTTSKPCFTFLQLAIGDFAYPCGLIIAIDPNSPCSCDPINFTYGPTSTFSFNICCVPSGGTIVIAATVTG